MPDKLLNNLHTASKELLLRVLGVNNFFYQFIIAINCGNDIFVANKV